MQRLHNALISLGVETQMRYYMGTMNLSSAKRVVYAKHAFDRFLERARYSIENRLLNLPPRSYFSRMVFHRSTPLPLYDHGSDIIHLHWVGRWLDLTSFCASIPNELPLVWSIHDMSALAGGCFLNFGCSEFDSGCRICPLLKFPFDRVWANQELKRRVRVLQHRHMAFVANSQSTLQLVKQSHVARGKLHKVIHPGIDFSDFKNIPRCEARAALGIPDDAFVLGFGSASLTDLNKGIDRFYQVAQMIRAEIPDTMALIFGDGNPELKIPTRNLGMLKNPDQLAQAYSAMDAHLVTSQMETFGQVSVEAQACGTPAFAFAVGGLPETLVDGQTGGLAPFDECKEMAGQILSAHKAGRLEAMGQAGAEWVRGQFDSLVVAKKYVEVYEELLAGSSNNT
jgi:glycosyltransferase involved in cell wall biosynthesis